MKINYSNNNLKESTCKVTDEICLPDSKLPRVVVIGGGFAGLALVEKLKHKEVQVVLFDKNNFHQFQPLLYQVATSALELESIEFPYRKQINGYENVFFRLAELEEIQPITKAIITNKG
jgi:NADH dehydrogenase